MINLLYSYRYEYVELKILENFTLLLLVKSLCCEYTFCVHINIISFMPP